MRVQNERSAAGQRPADDDAGDLFRSELVVTPSGRKQPVRQVAAAAEKQGVRGFESDQALLAGLGGTRGSLVSAARLAGALEVLASLEARRGASFAKARDVLTRTKRLLDYIADRRSAPPPQPQRKAVPPVAGRVPR